MSSRSALARAAMRQWREPAVLPRPARLGLDLALRPSPALKWIRRLLPAAVVVHAVHLVWAGSWAVALLVCALAAVGIWKARAPGHRSAVPRRLLVSADGRMHLLDTAGGLEAVRLNPASMRIGTQLLLVLDGSVRRHRLLLGPGNIDPAALAGLRRRLATLSASAERDAPRSATGSARGGPA